MKKNIVLTLLAVLLSLGMSFSAIADDRYQAEDKKDNYHGRYRHRAGSVFVMSNAAEGNEIFMYERKADGKLDYIEKFPTGGLGSGVGQTVPIDPLGSQNSLVLTPGGRFLYAVNAGDDTVTLFKVRKNHLKFLHRVDSGGRFPVSIAVFGRMIYVLNAGGNDGSTSTPGNITGFVRRKHRLKMIPDSTRTLVEVPRNPNDVEDIPNILATPAQVQFSPYGDLLVVTIKDGVNAQNNAIWTYNMKPHKWFALPDDAPFKYQTAGPVPFGFTFDTFGRLIVTDAGASTVTAYKIDDGQPDVIGAPAETGQAATCWIAATRPFVRFVYAANTGSGTLTGYRVRLNGSLSEIDLFPVKEGALNIDLAVTRDGRYLYTQNAGLGTVSIFKIGRNGILNFVDETTVTGPVSGFQGIAAW